MKSTTTNTCSLQIRARKNNNNNNKKSLYFESRKKNEAFQIIGLIVGMAHSSKEEAAN